MGLIAWPTCMNSPTRKTFNTRNLHVHGSTVAIYSSELVSKSNQHSIPIIREKDISLFIHIDEKTQHQTEKANTIRKTWNIENLFNVIRVLIHTLTSFILLTQFRCSSLHLWPWSYLMWFRPSSLHPQQVSKTRWINLQTFPHHYKFLE